MVAAQTKSISEAVDEVLANPTTRGPLYEFGLTPAILRLLGCTSIPLTIAPSILYKLASGKSGDRTALSKKQIESIPMLIDEASAIFSEKNDTLAIITREIDTGQRPILIYVRTNVEDRHRRVNAITTAFGKDYAMQWLEGRLKAGTLRYVGEKQNPRLSLPGLIYNRTGAGRAEGSIETILSYDDLRKYREEIRSETLGKSISSSQIEVQKSESSEQGVSVMTWEFSETAMVPLQGN